MANFNFNKVIIGGRLTADPELKTTPTGISVTSFTIAVNRSFGSGEKKEQQADFFNVTAWRQTAEFITRFFRKSSSIAVMGSLQNRSWVDSQGIKRYATEIVADEAYFVDAKSEMPQARNPAPPISEPPAGYYGKTADPYAAAAAGAYAAEGVSDDEVPF